MFEKEINDHTKVGYAETIGNPNANLIDIDAVAAVAYKHGFLVIIDNTFATPYLYRTGHLNMGLTWLSTQRPSSSAATGRLWAG